MAERVDKGAFTFSSVEGLIEILKNDKNYKEAIKQGCNNYNVSQYKINKIRLEEIPELVNLIDLNYFNLEKDNQHHHDKKKCSWLANQLKLFVWMAICHSYLSGKPLEDYQEDDWASFTLVFTRKTCSDLQFQIKSVFKNFHGNKQKWDFEQEELLKLIIQDDEFKNKWNEVSRLLYFRSNKKYYRSPQKCREYWFNHLDPTLNKDPWTIDEELKLVKELQTYGFKWSKLTQIIQNTWGYRRTEHMVKNRTKLLCKKYGFNDEKEEGCMKELARIQKKLQQQKLKNSQSATTIKQEDSLDSKGPIYMKPELQDTEDKKQEKPKKVQKQQKKAEKKPPKKAQKAQKHPKPQQSSEELKAQESEVNLDSSSEEQDFEDEKPKKKTASKTDDSQNKRNVIILFQANNQAEEEKEIEQAEEEAMMDEEEESPEIMIGQHVDEPIDNEEMREENGNEGYEDEYNILEDVEDNPNMDLNEEMQFQHHTHGGTMRERVTHELAKFFPSAENPTPSG